METNEKTKIEISEESGILTLPNGAEWTQEAYTDFGEIFGLSPIEFYDLNVQEKVIEIDNFIYTIELLEDLRVSVTRKTKD